METKNDRNTKSLLTIITAVYNGENFLEQTINSIINQNYTNLEYIIIDGGSTDRTLDIIKKYENYIDYWVSEKDNGIYDAWNKGIEASNGDIIGIISADDWYEENVFFDIVELYSKYKEKFLFFGNIQMIGSNNDKIYIKSSDFELLKRKMSVNHPTTFLSKDLYKQKKFDDSFHITGDYEFFLYLYKLNMKEKINIITSDKIIVNMRIDGVSDKFSSLFRVIKEDFKARKLYLSSMESYKYYYLDIFYKLPKKLVKHYLVKLGFKNFLDKRMKNKFNL